MDRRGRVTPRERVRTPGLSPGLAPAGSAATPDVAAQVVAVIEELIATASPEDRTRLGKLRDAVLSVGSSAVAQVLAKLATSGV